MEIKKPELVFLITGLMLSGVGIYAIDQIAFVKAGELYVMQIVGPLTLIVVGFFQFAIALFFRVLREMQNQQKRISLLEELEGADEIS